MKHFLAVLSLLCTILGVRAVAAPAALTYQGRILKSDNTPLEHSAVAFVFQITNPSGSCIIYQEQVTGVDMTNSKGIFDVAIGTGTVGWPNTGSFSVIDAFSDNSFSCGLCVGLACSASSSIYNPAVTDGRLLRVSFYDGNGWKTVSPDTTIRSVPFAGHATSAQKLGAYTATDFLLKAGLPNCGPGTYLNSNGGTLSCSTPAGGGTSGTVTEVTSTNTYLTVTNGTTTPAMTLNVGAVANTLAAGDDPRFTDARTPTGAASADLSGAYPNPTVAKIKGYPLDFTMAPAANQYLKFDGTNWVAGDISAASLPPGTLTGSGIAGYVPFYDTTSTVANSVLYQLSGKVGIGTTSPAYKLDVAGDINVTGNFKINGTNITGGATSLTGDVGGTSSATSVDKLKGVALNMTSLTTGNFLKYNGSNWINTALSSADLSDAASLIKSSQMPANCASGQTLTFSSPTGSWNCTNIVVTASNFGSQTQNTFLAAPNGSAGAPSFRAIAAADLPSGTLAGSGTAGYIPYYSAANTLANSEIFQSGGYVGIGTGLPGSILDINGAETMRGMAVPAVSSAGQGRIYFDSTVNKYKVSQDGGPYVDLLGSATGDFMKDGTVAMTGPLKLASGSQAAPGMTFDSDRDSGIYSGGADTLFFSTGGTYRLYLGSTFFISRVPVLGQAGSAAAPSYSYQADDNTGFFNPSGDNLALSTAGVERMRVDATGNVGIGTINPGAKLEVVGQVKITGGTPGVGKVLTSDAVGLATWESPAGVGLTAIADKRILANTSGMSAVPTETSLSALIDSAATATHGDILYRSASGWTGGAPDIVGLVDKTSAQTVSGAKTFTNYIQMNAQNLLRLADSDSSHYIALRSPATIPTNVTLTLPSTAGTSGNVLTTDGSGTLSWTAPASAPVTSVAGKTGAVTLDVGDIGNGSTKYFTYRPNNTACTNGQILVWNNTNSRWECGTDAVGAPGGSSGQVQFNNSSAFSGSANLFWNNVSSRLGIGTASPAAALHVVGDIQFSGVLTDVSDRRLKKQIKPLDGGLNIIRKIKTYSYIMKDDPKEQTEFGVIAQEIQPVLSPLVRNIDDHSNFMGVNYIGLIPWTILAVQESDRQIASVAEENTKLRNKILVLEQPTTEDATTIENAFDSAKRCPMIRLVTLFATFFLASIAGADCTSPAAKPGGMDYYTSSSAYRVCTGTVWKEIRYGGLSKAAMLTDTDPLRMKTISAGTVSGSYAYLTDSSANALYIWDVTNAVSPALKGVLINANLNTPSAITVSGNYAYIGGYNSLSVVDISDPSSPTYLGRYNGSSKIVTATSVAVVGNNVYVASSGISVFAIINVATKTAPFLEGSLAVSTKLIANKVVVDGNYAYLAGSNCNCLPIIDISNPASPTMLSSYAHASFTNIKSVGISGTYAFVVTQNGKIVTVDVSNKSSPLYAAVQDYHYYCCDDIEVSGSVAYISTSQGITNGDGIMSFDISNPLSPVFISGFATPRRITSLTGADKLAISGYRIIAVNNTDNAAYVIDLGPRESMPNTPGVFYDSSPPTSYTYTKAVVVGNTLVMGSSDNSLYAVNIVTPTVPTKIGGFIISPGSNMTGLETDGQYVYSVDSNSLSLKIIDYATPSDPVVRLRFSISVQPTAMTLNSGYAYIGGYGGMTIVDLTTPLSPVSLWTDSTITDIKSIAVSGNYAFVARPQKIEVYNISNKAGPTLVSTLTDSTNFANTIYDMTISGNYLYAMVGSYLRVVNISSPTALTIAASVNLYSSAQSAKISGNYIHITTDYYYYVYNISNPTAPVSAASVSYSAPTLALSGTYAYIGRSAGISVHPLATPSGTAITTMTYTGTVNNISGVATSGNYVYVTSDNTLKVLDVTNRDKPVYAGSSASTNLTGAKDFVIDGSYAYVTATNRLTVMSLSSPTAPTSVGTYSNATNLPSSRDVRVVGNYAFVLSANRLAVINVTTKTAPTYVSSLSNAALTGCLKLEVSGNYAYAACAMSLVIMDISNPATPTYVSSYFNATLLSGVNSLAISGNYAFLGAENTGGGAVVDITNKASPVVYDDMSTYGTGISVKTVAVRGNLLIWANYYSLGVVSLSNRAGWNTIAQRAPIKIDPVADIAFGSDYMVTTTSTKAAINVWNLSASKAAVETASIISSGIRFGSYNKTASSGSNLYVIKNSSLAVLDFTNPLSPVILNTMDEPKLEDVVSMAIYGSKIYLSYSNNYFGTIDISNPAAPKFGRVVHGPVQSAKVAVADSGTVAYTVGSDKLNSVNVNGFDGDSVYQSFTTNMSGISGGVAAAGNYVYTCAPTAQIFSIINAANPKVMTVVGSVSSTSFSGCQAVRVDGNYAYVSGTTSPHFSVIDISNPATPTIVGALANTKLSSVTDLEIDGNNVIALSGSSYLSIIDVTTKTTPTLVTSATDTLLSSLAKIGNYIYCGDLSGISIYQNNPSVNLGACAPAGQFDYDSTLNVAKFCDGTTWWGLGPSPGAGGAGCISPNAGIGSIDYDTTATKYRYCDGTTWVTIPTK